MTIVNGNYKQLSADEIRRALETELRDEFGADIDLTESSVFSTLANSLATVLSDNQEASLQEVYNAAFLETATGIDLDRVVSIIGIQRRPATHASGVERFSAGTRVSTDYTIQRGTRVQTDGTPATEFETTETTALELIDDFEGESPLAKYSGDAGNASIVTDSNAPRGNSALELDATRGTLIYNDDIELQQGTTFHCYVKPTAGSVPTVIAGLDPNNPGSYYQFKFEESNDMMSVQRIDQGSFGKHFTSISVALNPGTWYELEVDWDITGEWGMTVNDVDGNELATGSFTDGTYLRGSPGFKSDDANGTKRFDFYTTSSVSANIRAIEGGENGNVGPNSITSLPSPPAGVDTATNLYPTGSTEYNDTNDQQFVVGREEEGDEDLRTRAQEAVTGGGDATHDALVAALVNETAGVTSVTVYENNTPTDNTGSGGLPPHSFEAVVFGGDSGTVAETIFDKKAITARDYAGVNGTKVEETVTSDVNGQVRTVEFSRPTEVDVDLTLDLVIDDSYAGDDSVRDAITRYIGGLTTDSVEVVGLGVGEDVRIDRIQDLIVGDDTGVIGLDQSVDGSPIETTPAITTADGLRVVEVGANEVAQADATDASITINTREL